MSISTTYSLSELANVCHGKLVIQRPENETIQHLLTDSRKLIGSEGCLFIAISGINHDGHQYIPALCKQSVLNFIVEKDTAIIPGANFIIVENSLRALQQIATFHRSHFNYNVIGITGSNGKTMVKEWLYHLLKNDKHIVRSPKSYNSQLGVPLSVWQMDAAHNLGLFEAGISKPNEMFALQKIIRPTIGIFTNIGTAHNENFSSVEAKVIEKLKLFIDARVLIYSKDYPPIVQALSKVDFLPQGLKQLTWSRKVKADLQVGRIVRSNGRTELQAIWHNQFINLKIQYTDEASIENSITCWLLLLHLGYDIDTIQQHMLQLQPVAMRLELKEGINNCAIINDSYNNDMASLAIALNFLNQQQQHPKKTLILSDLLQTGEAPNQLYKKIGQLLEANKINNVITIGDQLASYHQLLHSNATNFLSTNDFLDRLPAFRDETILVKGARKFEFERIVKALERKAHETVLEVNLNALIHNLNYYRGSLGKKTKVMAMVKASGYGSGSFEIANALQFHHTDYLAVAYTDEGVELRKAGIQLPIMVMNPEPGSIDKLITYRLEPEVYSFRVLDQINLHLNELKDNSIFIHLKIDTGMNRLGFRVEEKEQLLHFLKSQQRIRVKSIFTHLVASDEAEHDEFTRQQIQKFEAVGNYFRANIADPILLHALNSAGTTRFPNAQLDMVRLGLGLYGISANKDEQGMLAHVLTLKTSISQIKKVRAGETVGYGRRGKVQNDSTIATIAIGYADGINRHLGNGKGKFLINNVPVATIGNICMDMCMIDITNVSAKEGDEVIIFGPQHPIQELSTALHTIPYEIIAGLSQRIKRVYYQE
ncbi:MAG: hypothetical protein RIQ89_194 [Bacteroidota bacterium]